MNIAANIALSQIQEWERIFYKNTKHFIGENSRFKNVWEFTDIYFSSERVKIYYILPCGQHVSDSVGIGSFLEFINYYGETEEK